MTVSSKEADCFLPFCFLLCFSVQVLKYCSLLVFFSFPVQVGCMCVYFNLLCLPSSSVRMGYQPQSSLLAQVCKVTSHCHTPKSLRMRGPLKFWEPGSNEAPEEQRSECLSLTAKESAASPGLLILKNPLMQVIWVYVSKESWCFYFLFLEENSSASLPLLSSLLHLRKLRCRLDKET